MEILNYKCPCCDAVVEFNGKEQQLVCKFCDTTFEIDTIKQYNEASKAAEEEWDVNWDTKESNVDQGEWNDGDTENMTMYTCPSCAAQIVADESTAATFCLYCGNSTILQGKVSGLVKPDFVIPFKMTKEDAKAALKNFYKGKKLLPDCFSEENRIDSIKGIYVPFWLFDGDADARINYKATRVKHWSDSKYRYTKTDHYLITREGSMGFEHIPSDGSSKADDKFMESIEPYNISEAVDFETAYLSGYFADKYDVEAEQCKDKVNERIRVSTIETFRDSVVGYSSVTPKDVNIQIKQGKIKYALMPVWMLNTKYKGKIYTFAMNGQTGKVAGSLPVSKAKYMSWLFGVSLTCATVISALYLLFVL